MLSKPCIVFSSIVVYNSIPTVSCSNISWNALFIPLLCAVPLTYVDIAEQLDINVVTREYEGIWNVHDGHIWPIMWDEEKYCKIDGINVYCYPRENHDERKV